MRWPDDRSMQAVEGVSVALDRSMAPPAAAATIKKNTTFDQKNIITLKIEATYAYACAQNGNFRIVMLHGDKIAKLTRKTPIRALFVAIHEEKKKKKKKT